MKYFILSFIFLSKLTFSQSVLVIGDSHMAGYFGKNLFDELLYSKKFKNIVVLGHASSAPKDWIASERIKLSGGVLNIAYLGGKTFINPSPTHWKEEVEVPDLSKLMKNIIYRSEWRKTNLALTPDYVVVELGANDMRAIADPNGVLKKNEYNYRLNKMKLLIDKILLGGAKCLFVTPPDGAAKNPKSLKLLYKMINEGTKDRCELYDQSLKFKAEGKESGRNCDGYHFQCSKKDRDKAHTWAKEVANFISSRHSQ